MIDDPLGDLRRRMDDLRREVEALGRREDAGDISGVVGSAIHGASAKTTPVDADTMPLIDSAASNALKKVTWANIKATLKTYFDTLYAPKAAVSARVFNSAAISIPHDTATTLTFNSEQYDTTSLHSTASNTGRLTAPVAGKYLITAHVVFAGVAAAGLRYVSLVLNSTTNLATQQVNQDSTNPSFLSVASVYPLAAGDYVTTVVLQTSGGALNVNRHAEYSPEFTMTLLGT